MKIELLIIGITIFFIYDTYHEGKYSKLLKSWKKYYQMAGFAFIGLSVLLFFKKHPQKGQGLLAHACDLVKCVPVDKNSFDILEPFLPSTNSLDSHSFNQNDFNNITGGTYISPQQKRILNSGNHNATKRSVSETKKKFVASKQDWRCGHCNKQLPAWFEVDHIIRLEHGGSNHIDNLVALCRDCHGKKTALENM